MLRNTFKKSFLEVNIIVETYAAEIEHFHLWQQKLLKPTIFY